MSVAVEVARKGEYLSLAESSLRSQEAWRYSALDALFVYALAWNGTASPVRSMACYQTGLTQARGEICNARTKPL